MTVPAHPTAATDPRQTIIAAVRAAEPGLPQATVETAVDHVADTRAKRRRLAAALERDRGLLTNGRPEGPRLIELLVRELEQHDLERITRPRCAGCGEPHRLRRVVEGRRVCQTCANRVLGRPRLPCAVCGKTLEVSGRDREGRPRCQRHRVTFEEAEDVAAICGLVDAVDHGLPGDTIVRLIEEALPQPHQRRDVLNQLRNMPGLLTGDGAHGSPRVIALIDALIADGARGVTAPACPLCGRTVPLKFKHGKARCCRRCYEAAHARVCSRCGDPGVITSQTTSGEPLCLRCTRADPANHDTCTLCGELTLCRRQGDGSRVCLSCYQEPLATCSQCGKLKPCYRAATANPICLSCSRSGYKAACITCRNVRMIAYRAPDGGPLCQACGETTEPCSICGRNSRVITRTPDGPVCRNCYRVDPRFVRTCERCGTVEHLYHHGLCNRCAARRWLRSLLAEPDGAVRAELEDVIEALTAGPPMPLLNLLERSTKRDQIQRLRTARGGISHGFLDGPEQARTPRVCAPPSSPQASCPAATNTSSPSSSG